MTQEEKARAYDEAIQRAKEINNEHKAQPFNVMLKVFPELKESEERIRKAIIESLPKYGYLPQTSIKVEDAIAWLEKQGEPFDKEKVLIGARKDVALSIINYLDNNSVGMCLSNMECEDIEDACINSKWTKLYNYMQKKLEKQGDKPFDYENADIQQKDFAPKVEPKFKVGDWIANDYCMGKVIALTDDAYLLDTEQGIPFSCEHNVHLWTIADAKDGDVLQLGLVTAIFKNFIGNGCCTCYCSVWNGEFEIPRQDSSYGCHNATPATKEQRDLLFAKMKEAGYEWDAEKKELKKVEQNPVEWSEEDERMRQYVVNDLRFVKELVNDPNYAVSVEMVEKEIDWMESFKERYTWKPSDEQLYFLHWLATNVLTDGEVDKKASEVLESLYQELKKLREG